ncbi:hypothetical protein SAMN05444274_11094 [Mariniphaga anaerophila]|uniref:Uncharacterized protein n=1 Tax=Mariniphaga anaerophila TaxID=1484053 RepID=A0A1M5EZ70_9BACT|nr:hypothetical protein SAMN05444274_11094 [Mariniphaga anaerophila]
MENTSIQKQKHMNNLGVQPDFVKKTVATKGKNRESLL